MIRELSAGVEPLALFGGTFDPVHYGHLRCADEVRLKLGLKTLYLLPAGNPPHRGLPQATVEQRLDMLQLACLEFPSLKIDDRETRRHGPSYMVDTLQEFRTSFRTGHRFIGRTGCSQSVSHLVSMGTFV